MKLNIYKSIVYSLIFFLCGGILLPRLEYFSFNYAVKGEPAIYYQKIEIIDNAGQPISGATFSWSNSISLVIKEPAPYVVDEISDGIYIIAVAGGYQISSIEIRIAKEGFVSESIKCDALPQNNNEFYEDNYKIGNYKLVLQRV